MSDTSIRLSETAKTRLELHKRDDESYDDVIRRLTAGNKWVGFGVASGDPAETRSGLEFIRESMRSNVAGDLEEFRDD